MSRQLNLVRQEDSLGCMIACAAMIVGCSYQEARAAIGVVPPGYELVRFLNERGYEQVCKAEHFWPCYREEPPSQPWPPQPWADLHLVSVVPHGEDYYRHAVLMLKDGTVIDPNKPEPGKLSDYPRVEQVSEIRRANQEFL